MQGHLRRLERYPLLRVEIVQQKTVRLASFGGWAVCEVARKWSMGFDFFKASLSFNDLNSFHQYGLADMCGHNRGQRHGERHQRRPAQAPLHRYGSAFSDTGNWKRLVHVP